MALKLAEVNAANDDLTKYKRARQLEESDLEDLKKQQADGNFNGYVPEKTAVDLYKEQVAL